MPHERPEAMERSASVMMVGLGKRKNYARTGSIENTAKDTLRHVADYSMPNVSEKVLCIILSYTDYE